MLQSEIKFLVNGHTGVISSVAAAVEEARAQYQRAQFVLEHGKVWASASQQLLSYTRPSAERECAKRAVFELVLILEGLEKLYREVFELLEKAQEDPSKTDELLLKRNELDAEIGRGRSARRAKIMRLSKDIRRTGLPLKVSFT